MLFYGTSYILSANQDSEDKRIHLVEHLMDNNLGYSLEAKLSDILRWEEKIINTCFSYGKWPPMPLQPTGKSTKH